MDFNQEQLTIINHLNGALLVNAPVGTGKTAVLTERVIKALASGIKPAEILCLTFTNRAAEEMRGRVRQAVNSKEAFDELTVSTFHGWCAYFLKSEAKELGLVSDFTIIDEDEQIAVLKSVIAQFADKLYLDENSSRNEFNAWLENLYHYRLAELEHKIGIIDKAPADDLKAALAAAYEQALNEQNALDFNQLVLQTLTALYFNEGIKNKWAARYKFIQLDEFQDTHLSEYLVIKELAKQSKNIALIGDLDQTIYSWRGSEPKKIAAVFKQHFAPVAEMSLSVNYRSSSELLSVMKNILLPSTSLKADALKQEDMSNYLKVFNAHNFSEEIDWVTNRVRELNQTEPQASIAVLARANYLINQAAEVFVAKKLPHLTVDHYNFFRRQEVKDALAHLKILLNRFDLDSAYRVALRPPKDLGEATLSSIRASGDSAALKISDFFYLPNFSRNEPFGQLLSDYASGRVVVLDTETTGINAARDEVIQIYAREVVKGQAGEALHYYVKNTVPVGASTAVHRLTDEFLAANGLEPQLVLAELKDFIGSSAVIGHNVGFDINMLAANGARYNIEFVFKNFYDTLDLAKRLVATDSYKLSSLAKLFNLSGATHSADEDVNATISLLAILIGKLKLTGEERQKMFANHAKKFIRLATQLTNWQYLIAKERPARALAKIIEDSGLKDYYAKQGDATKRLASLESLVKFFGQRDDLNKSPADSLRDIVSLAALTKSVDFVALNQGRTPLVTVHQVKGLEFDHVFLVGLNEGDFPSWRSKGQEEIAEEKRLFYVALTRAKKSVNLTYSNFDRFGRPSAKSRFLNYLQ